jgi:hypothetical protein
MTHTPAQIETWVAELLNEAERDLVFLWNIQRGSFGGLGFAPDKPTLAKVIEGLVTGGCTVSFGDPSFSKWIVPPELEVSSERLPATIIQFWEANPKANEFITFALRESKGAANEG